MGYDMNLAAPTGELLAKKEAYEQRMDEAYNISDPAVRSAALSALPEDPTYFRLNIWGMGAVREKMASMGMLVDVPGPKYIPRPEGSEDEPNLDWEAKVEMDSGAKGIPLYKLCSNNGWLVTPREIRAAMANLLKGPSPEMTVEKPKFESSMKALFGVEDEPELDEKDWLDWLEYLDLAEQNGGFVVW